MLNVVDTVILDWDKLHRLIPSQFPPIGLFEEVVDPDDLDMAYAIESLTNDRIRQEVGDLNLVPLEQRISGVGSTPVMAAFTHIGIPSRFTDGTNYGVYYGAKYLNTAIKETVFHRENFLRRTNEPDTEITMRCYVNRVVSPLHDIRGIAFNELHDEEDYAIPQSFAKRMRDNGTDGLVYNSVRHVGGECVAVFNPKALSLPVQTEHFKYQWRKKENKIVNVLKVSKVYL
jgi:hypothetical protein